MTDPGWLSYHPDPTKPAFRPPAGAVDAHCHVFGPAAEFPYAPERKYTPSDAGKAELFALRDFLGFDRSVIVQATCHGADNRALVDALTAAGDRARGIATVTAATTDEELAWLHEAGVRGVRFNFVRRLVHPEPEEYYLELVERIRPFGWHVVVYLEADDLLPRSNFLASLPTTVVFDHMGRPDVTLSVTGPEFALFRQLLREHENFWTKVTGAERVSVGGPPRYDDVVPFARTLTEEFSDRVLWGTDWPHPNMKSHVPDDGALVDLVPRIAPTEHLREQLLVTNPMRLYWGQT